MIGKRDGCHGSVAGLGDRNRLEKAALYAG